jgi:hypothetical protein
MSITAKYIYAIEESKYLFRDSIRGLPNYGAVVETTTF